MVCTYTFSIYISISHRQTYKGGGHTYIPGILEDKLLHVNYNLPFLKTIFWYF